MFRRGEMNTEDSGCQKEVTTNENIKKIDKIILNDRELKLNDIAVIFKISTDRVHNNIHE